VTFPSAPSAAVVDGSTKLTTRDLNIWRAWFPHMVDRVGGGTYCSSQVVSIGDAGIALAAGNRVGIQSRRVTRQMSLAGSTESANWAIDSGTFAWENSATGGTVWFALERLPDGGSLESVTLWWIGGAGHASDPVNATALTMPALEAFEVDQSGARTSLGSVSDGTVVKADYEVAHAITVAGLATTIDLTTKRYGLELTGELGGEYVANARAHSLSVVCIVNEYAEWT
jgi:hypothetical protein